MRVVAAGELGDEPSKQRTLQERKAQMIQARLFKKDPGARFTSRGAEAKRAALASSRATNAVPAGAGCRRPLKKLP